MKNISIRNVTEACGGKYYGDAAVADKEISSVYIDSRKVEKGSLFIPVVGGRVDGHDFIEQAFEKGALCTLSEKKLDGKFPYIHVSSTLQALKDIAAFYLRQLAVPVVGVTGSVGKTSTKEVIANVLEQGFCTLKTEGNFNNEIGLPLTVFRLRDEHEAAVLEMGISDFGEMSRLTQIARPDIAVITNIGLCHLENLGSRDGILKAKTEIFEGLKENGSIILNGDDDKLRTIREYRGIRPVFFGISPENDIYADNIENLGLKGTICMIHTPEETFKVQIHVPGVHMVSNALAACAVGRCMGLSVSQIRDGIESLQPVKGRMNLIHTGKYTIIDDCYNANPVSMKSSIDLLKEASGRKVCILGDMFELGENENMLHGEVGAYVAETGVDVLVTVGKRCEYMHEEALRSETCQCWHFDNKKDAMEELENIMCRGDSVLVKASHGMEFPEIVSWLEKEN